MPLCIDRLSTAVCSQSIPGRQVPPLKGTGLQSAFHSVKNCNTPFACAAGPQHAWEVVWHATLPSHPLLLGRYTDVSLVGVQVACFPGSIDRAPDSCCMLARRLSYSQHLPFRTDTGPQVSLLLPPHLFYVVVKLHSWPH